MTPLPDPPPQGGRGTTQVLKECAACALVSSPPLRGRAREGGDIIATARSWIGTPYRHQASVKGVGCDCLGLVRGVWREAIGPEPEAMPAYSPDWAEAGGRETLAETASRHMTSVVLHDMRAGDLVLFRWRRHLPAKHAGLLSGDDHFIHAQDGAAVCEAALTSWWRRRIAYVFRFPAET